MQVQAITKNIRMSAQKMREVVRQIQGLPALQAQAVLAVVPRKSARVVAKTLRSAIANAENNHDLDVDDLVVKEASVGKNLVMKRFHARARGNAGGIEKFFSQITIIVEEVAEEKRVEAAVPGKKSAGKKPAAKNPAAQKASKAKKEAA